MKPVGHLISGLMERAIVLRGIRVQVDEYPCPNERLGFLRLAEKHGAISSDEFDMLAADLGLVEAA